MRETTRPGRHATFEGEACRVEVIAIVRQLEDSSAPPVEVWMTAYGLLTEPTASLPAVQLHMTPEAFDKLAHDLAAVNGRVQAEARRFRQQIAQERTPTGEKVTLTGSGPAAPMVGRINGTR